MPALLGAMASVGMPGVPLSTCNRSEFYFLNAKGEDSRRLKNLLAPHFGVSHDDLEQFLYEHRGYNAIQHLFRVASGLDSMILGEDQIIGQVRQAYGAASEEAPVPSLLARLFQQASRVGRRVRRDSGIGRHALSVSRACVEMARSVVGDLSSSCVLVVGAGEAGETAAEALNIAGARNVTVVNRTYSRAEDLAARLSGRAVAFEALHTALSQSDIVIGCTGSPGYVLRADHIRTAMATRPERPLLLMDIAVPRDIDPRRGYCRATFLSATSMTSTPCFEPADRRESGRQPSLKPSLLRKPRDSMNGSGAWIPCRPLSTCAAGPKTCAMPSCSAP